MNRHPRSTPWLALGATSVDDPDPEPGTWRAALDGDLCRSDEQFFDEAARALQFPSYFGRNWDAFDECFSDLLDVTDGGMGHAFGGRAGEPGRALHLTVHHADHLLDRGRPDALQILLGILGEDPAAVDRPDGVHVYADFRARLVCAPEALESFTSRLTAAGLRPTDVRQA